MFDEIAIRAGQQSARHFDDRDLRAERGVDRAELEADVAAADDEQRLRDVGQIERGGRVHQARALDRQARHGRRPRTGRDDRVLERQRLGLRRPSTRSMSSVRASRNAAVPWR